MEQYCVLRSDNVTILYISLTQGDIFVWEFLSQVQHSVLRAGDNNNHCQSRRNTLNVTRNKILQEVAE